MPSSSLSPGETTTADDLRSYTLEHLAALQGPAALEVRRRTAAQRHRQGGQGPSARPAPDRGRPRRRARDDAAISRRMTQARRDDPVPNDVHDADARTGPGRAPTQPARRDRGRLRRSSELTYPELDVRTDNLARAFVGAGVAHGDASAVARSELPPADRGLARLRQDRRRRRRRPTGARAPTRWSPSSTTRCPKVVIWQEEEIGTTVAEARSRWRGKARWLSARRRRPATRRYEAFLADGATSPPLGTELGADQVSPVGPGARSSTPEPSAARRTCAQLSHRAILAQALMVAMVQRITARDRVPQFGADVPHGHPDDHLRHLSKWAAPTCSTRRVDAEELCRLIEAERCNYGFVMGPTVRGDHSRSTRTAATTCRSFRTFGGSPRWNEMMQRRRQPLGHPPRRVRPDRGHRHADVQRAGNRDRWDERAALAVGARCASSIPTASTCRSARPARSSRRGPIVTNGYHDTARAQRAAHFRGGWWHTGDLGRRHADGSLTFVAPLTRIVKSAAENIYPAEVEGCLVQHPGGARGRDHRGSRPAMDPAGARRGGPRGRR